MSPVITGVCLRFGALLLAVFAACYMAPRSNFFGGLLLGVALCMAEAYGRRQERAERDRRGP